MTSEGAAGQKPPGSEVMPVWVLVVQGSRGHQGFPSALQ